MLISQSSPFYSFVGGIVAETLRDLGTSPLLPSNNVYKLARIGKRGFICERVFACSFVRLYFLHTFGFFLVCVCVLVGG